MKKANMINKELVAMIEEYSELTEELLGYVSAYFQEKYNLKHRIEKLKLAKICSTFMMEQSNEGDK